jgi:ribosomal protein S18 acetylase RimI-like enzyme
MGEVTVRWAVAGDAAVLLEIEQTSWDGSTGFPSMVERMSDNFFAKSGPEVHLVAEVDGVVVGYLRLENKYSFPEGTGVLAVNGLAVAPAARGQGAASALLTAATEEARSRDARKLSLHVFGSNATARRLYERHGYVVEATHPAEFVVEGQSMDDVVLVKLL